MDLSKMLRERYIWESSAGSFSRCRKTTKVFQRDRGPLVTWEEEVENCTFESWRLVRCGFSSGVGGGLWEAGLKTWSMGSWTEDMGARCSGREVGVH